MHEVKNSEGLVKVTREIHTKSLEAVADCVVINGCLAWTQSLCVPCVGTPEPCGVQGDASRLVVACQRTRWSVAFPIKLYVNQLANEVVSTQHGLEWLVEEA